MTALVDGTSLLLFVAEYLFTDLLIDLVPDFVADEQDLGVREDVGESRLIDFDCGVIVAADAVEIHGVKNDCWC